MNLYQVPSAYTAWLYAIDEAEGEITPELEAKLAEIEGTIQDKGDAVCALVRNATAEAEACRAEAKHFAERARVAENRANRLKALLLEAMQARGQEKLDTGRFAVAIRTSSTPSIRWTGLTDDLPEEFARVKVELDGQRAQQELRTYGKLPEGFSVEYTRYLAIK